MALATRCPHCDTTFRVASDQLKLRGGIVRCGACHEIFDGNASLTDLDAAPTAAPSTPPVHEPDPGLAAREDGAAESHPSPAADDEAEIPVYTLDLDATLDPLGILPKPETDAQSAPVEADAAQEDLFTPAVAEEQPPAEFGDAEQALPGQDNDTSLHGADAADADDDHLHLEDGAEVNDEHLHEADGADVNDDHPQDDDAIEADDMEAVGDPVVIEVDASDPMAEPFDAPAPAAETEGQAGANAGDAWSQERIEPTLDAPVDDELVTTSLPEHGAEPGAGLQPRAERIVRGPAEAPPLPMRESADGSQFTAAMPGAAAKTARARMGGRRSKLTPTKIAPPKLRVPEIDEPDFVKRGRQREQTGKRWLILMAVGSLLLAMLLLAQAAAAFRGELAARFPAAKPALASMCAVLRCRLELPARIDNLAIETGELQSLGPDTYVLTTLLHNQASLAQAWPDIELALTDANDKPLVRRVFAPADYLPKGAAPAAGFGAHAELPVKLYFQLDQLKPSGYHIAVFYP